MRNVVNLTIPKSIEGFQCHKGNKHIIIEIIHVVYLFTSFMNSDF